MSPDTKQQLREKYARMRKFGVPERSVRNCMMMDGFNIYDENGMNLSESYRKGGQTNWQTLSSLARRAFFSIIPGFRKVRNAAVNEEENVIETIGTAQDESGASTSQEKKQNVNGHLSQHRSIFHAPSLDEVTTARNNLRSVGVVGRE